MMHLAMIAQEDGFISGPGLTLVEVVTRFVIGPILLFAVIAGVAFALSAPRDKSGKSPITHIE